MEIPKTRCDELWFEHAREDKTENIVYAIYPPSYPAKVEVCKNCGLKRVYETKIETTISYLLSNPE